MGKQIYFVHTEEDIFQFLSFLEKVHGAIILEGAICSPTQVCDRIISEMKTHHHPKYTAMLIPYSSLCEHNKKASATDGLAIEILNCRKWECESRTYYDKGRIYLLAAKEGAYDREILTLYNKLRSYFRKNYIYHRNAEIYVSETFEKGYQHQKFYLSQLGHHLDLY